MTIHRLTSNIVFFTLGLNIALASASPKMPEAESCDTLVGCVHEEVYIKRIKISRPVRFREELPERLAISALMRGQ